MIFVSVRDASAWDFPPDSVWCLVGGWFELESSWRFEGFLLLKCQLVFLRFICDVVCFRVIPVICSFCCWGRWHSARAILHLECQTFAPALSRLLLLQFAMFCFHKL